MPENVVFFDIGDTLVSSKQWRPGARQALMALRAKGVRLGLISNTGQLDRDALASLLPDDFTFGVFEDGLVLLSSEIGIEKPNLSIFLLAVQHAGVSPWQTIFVGENLAETLAAQQAGMTSLRIADAATDFPALVKLTG